MESRLGVGRCDPSRPVSLLSGPDMSAELHAAADELRARLADFDPQRSSPAHCAVLVEVLAATEKAVGAAKARAAARAAAGGAHRAAGFADPGDWLARASGSTTGEANLALRTAAAIDDLPATKQAVVTGAVSIEQAHEIVRTEAERPGTEQELLGVAANAGLSTLRDRARRRRHEAIDRDELHRRQRRARHLRFWVDDLGMVALRGALPPEVGVPLLNRVDVTCDRLWRDARRHSAEEPREAYAADALACLVFEEGEPAASPAAPVVIDTPGCADGSTAALPTTRGAERSSPPTTGGAERSSPPTPPADRTPGVTHAGSRTGGLRRAPRAEVVVVVDLRALRRDHTRGDEPCHVIGGGPVPVSVARELLEGDAFVKAVLHDGVDVTTVAHMGRYKKAELRTALDLGEPPAFEGVTCSVPGCERRYGLQWDHINPVCNDGPTAYANLQPLCRPHHKAKTEHDRRAGLLDRRCPP